MATIDIAPLAPAEAVAYFRSKGYKTAFNWQDTWQEEHARAFTVAKAMRYDVLQDIRQAVDKALADGITFAEFKKDLTPTLQAKGWWGRKSMIDPATGKPRMVQLGSPRRLQIIYDTNLRMARAAGRWQIIERQKGRRPWLRYQAVLDSRTRPQHRDWHGTILPVDHDFWDTHYPPNGWRCRCIVQQLSDRDLKRYGWTPTDPAPAVDHRPYFSRRTGRTIHVPAGIDPGFGYNVGAASMRGLTPPPQSGPLTTPAINPPADLPMVPPRLQPASMLLPHLTSAEDAMLAFMDDFGAGRGKPVLFTDKIGEPLLISEDFFFRDTGELKLLGSDRTRAVKLMAAAIKDPDEIWWQWEKHEKTGEWRLRRRYIARFEVEGRSAPIMIVFDVSKAGWQGVTAFRPRKENYLDQFRAGTFAYRRP